MAVRISTQAGKVAYDLKEFIVDSYADIATINVKAIAPGSTAFVIDESKRYMLNHQRKWVKVNLAGGGTLDSVTSGEVDVIYDGGEVSSHMADNDVVYDGGVS